MKSQAHGSDTFYLGRQPILDRTQSLTGFELALRSTQATGTSGMNSRAAESLLGYAFGELGADSVLGRHNGAINLTPELLMSDTVACLPKERVMINLVEAAGMTPAIVERCRALKTQGYSLALDASLLQRSEASVLLPLTKIIKVDAASASDDALQAMVRAFKPSGRRLLATGVEHPEVARKCLEWGFDYLQGHYFARPEICPDRKLDHGQMALMRLLGLVMSDADLDEVVEAFKHYPDITLQLLRLANSAAVGARAPSTNIRQAVTFMGRNALRSWLQILMFSTGGVPGVAFPSPLMIQAATRGKLMELLAQNVVKMDRSQQDQAFMAGMLSLLSAQFSIELPELIGDLPLDDQVRDALLERAGRLGVLLFLVESLEYPGFSDMQMALDEIGVVEPEVMMSLQVSAMNWANSLELTAGK